MKAFSSRGNTLARSARGVLMPGMVSAGAIAIAILGALLIRGDGGTDGVNLFVESLSGSSGSFLSGLGIVAPLGFAFGAGVAAAFNPCGFAMLPAYMGTLSRSRRQRGQGILFRPIG